MEFWNNIYYHFDPVAIELFGLKIHWYGLMYVLALFSALMIAKLIVKKDNLAISNKDLDNYFIYVEIGVILGARIGYIIFYDPHSSYYLTHPWQMFNPFMNGEFVGIRGMSYHGALIGFLLATYIYTKRYNYSFGFLMDLVAVSIPLAYVFGRVGNFLNQELVGRETTSQIGIYVDGVLRHPSQLYEAFLEGFVVFLIIYFYRNYKKFQGELILIYGFSYSLARFIAEFWREPDFQMGFICCNFTMGQILSLLIILVCIIFYTYLMYLSKNREKF